MAVGLSKERRHRFACMIYRWIWYAVWFWQIYVVRKCTIKSLWEWLTAIAAPLVLKLCCLVCMELLGNIGVIKIMRDMIQLTVLSILLFVNTCLSAEQYYLLGIIFHTLANAISSDFVFNLNSFGTYLTFVVSSSIMCVLHHSYARPPLKQ